MMSVPPARKLDTGVWLERDPPPIPWRVEGIAADGYVTILAGRAGDSKSWLSLAWAVGVAGGATIAGSTCSLGRSLIIDAENGEFQLWRRYQAARGPRSGVAVYDGDGLNLASPEHAAWLAQTVREEGANLLVLDGLRTLAPGMEENNGDSVAPVMGNVRRIARTTQAAVVLLHHRGKDIAGYRGHSALRDQTDNLYVLERDRRDPENRTRRLLHADPARDGKMRIGPEPSDRWLYIDPSGGLLSIDIADPPAGIDAAPTRDEQLADDIRGVLRQAQEPLSGAAVARSLGRDKTDGTTRRMLDSLAADGEAERTAKGWVARVASNPAGNPSNDRSDGLPGCRPLRGVATVATLGVNDGVAPAGNHIGTLPYDIDTAPPSQPSPGAWCKCDKPMLGTDEPTCVKCGRHRPANALTADCEATA
jgi:AAA domain